MKKVKEVLKNRRWLYIITELLAIYFTYLLSKLWIIDVKGIVSIGVVATVTSLWLTNRYLKTTATYKLKKKKENVALFLITIAISSLLMIAGHRFFINDYVESEIKIESLTDKKISHDVIDGIIINNLVYLRYGEDFNDEYKNYEKIENDFIDTSIEDDILTIKIKRCYSAKLVLNYAHEDLKIEDGRNIKKVYSSGISSTYIVESNSTVDQYSILRGVASFLSLFYSGYLILTFILNPVNKNKKYFILTMLSVVGIGLFYINDCSLIVSPDSYTYIDFDFKTLLALRPTGRTPVYPLIVNGIRYLFDFNFLELVVVFQYCMWFLSIAFLYKTIEMLTKNAKLSCFFSILYAISPFAVIWNGSILTESLALSGTIVFIYYIIKYIKTDKVLYGNISIVLSLVMTFLRPTAIIYLVGLLIFIVMKLIFEKFKKSDIKCLITEILCLAFVVFYAICFQKVFGFYSISDAVVRQDLMVTIREGFYKNSDDEEFIKNIETALLNNPDNEWNAMAEVLVKYPCTKTRELTRDCRRKNLKAYINYLIRLTAEHAEVKFEGYAFINMNPRTLWIHNALHKSFAIITFLHVYLLIAIEIILMIVKWVKSKKVPWIYCGLFFFPLVIVVSSFIGTCGEFMRTACCCVPFAYLIFIMIMYDAFIKKGKSKAK